MNLNTNKKDIIDFNTKARWNLFGSAAFEALRIAHNTILAILFSPQIFGLVGSLFASTFFVVRLSDAGATNSLLPFFRYIERSQHTYKSFFVRHFLLPIFITAPIGAGFASVFLHTAKHKMLSSCAVILPMLIFSETVRAFLRQFLHLAGQSKQAVLTDHITFCAYVGISWPVLFFVPDMRTPFFIFALFLMDSLVGLVVFLILTHRFAKTLPTHSSTDEPSPQIQSFYLARLYAWLMRICKELFSSNALTPLFAATVGLKQAGLFYFGATLAMAMHAIMRSVIGYAGASFFISARKASMPASHAFTLVSQKLSRILLGLIAFFTFSYHDIIKLTHVSAAPSQLTIFFVLYFAIVIIEFTLLLYEQQYLFEQAGAKALQWRALELLLVYITTQGFVSFQPVQALICILLAKTGTLLALGLSGYHRWGVHLSWHMPKRDVFILLSIGLGLSFLFKVLVYGILII